MFVRSKYAKKIRAYAHAHDIPIAVPIFRIHHVFLTLKTFFVMTSRRSLKISSVGKKPLYSDPNSSMHFFIVLAPSVGSMFKYIYLVSDVVHRMLGAVVSISGSKFITSVEFFTYPGM